MQKENPQDDVDAVARMARAELRRRGKSDEEIDAELEAAERRREAGVETASYEDVATGHRRDSVRYEADPDQLVRLRATAKPEGPLPPQQASAAVERGETPQSSPPVEDVRVDPETRSVWDARPTGTETSGREPSA